MKKIFWIVLVAIFLRLGLAMSTYHSDLGAFAQAGRAIVGEGKWFSFYDTMLTPQIDTVFNYQPLAYLIPSVFYLPFKGIVLETGNLIKNHDWIIANSSLFNPLLLLYKYPMILADLAFLWLLPKFFGKTKDKHLSMVLWAFNPLAIYVSSMMGQVDIVIALFITYALYLYKEDKLFISVIFLALSALIKPAGLILIPLLALHNFVTNKKITESLLLTLTGLGVYLLGVLPYLGSIAYRHYALFAEHLYCLRPRHPLFLHCLHPHSSFTLAKAVYVLSSCRDSLAFFPCFFPLSSTMASLGYALVGYLFY
ncbi:MAG: hypothetical protein UW80_C0007G0023 [Microgenomates group bacterium GW2011_GWC1_44_9]|nr:MAG: hypothetical protein UW80_C0007G0023 [Microgenomates group bacterium GW2011_GWC1_44_9]